MANKIINMRAIQVLSIPDAAGIDATLVKGVLQLGVNGLGATGGGTSAGNFLQVMVDFGASETDIAQTIVTGQTWVTANSVIVCSLGAASQDHDVEDGLLEGVSAVATNLVPGVGFTVFAAAYNNTFGKYYINVFGQ